MLSRCSQSAVAKKTESVCVGKMEEEMCQELEGVFYKKTRQLGKRLEAR